MSLSLSAGCLLGSFCVLAPTAVDGNHALLRRKHTWREGGYRGCLTLTRKPRMASLGRKHGNF